MAGGGRTWLAVAWGLLLVAMAVAQAGHNFPELQIETADGEAQVTKMYTEDEYSHMMNKRAEAATAKAVNGDIHAAISTNDPKVIQMALDAGAGINERGYNQQTPLVRSCIKGWDESAKFLLEKGADVTLGDKEGYTPMHAAAFTGKHKIIRHLLAAGLDPMDRHSDGSTPLHRACWGSTLEHTETVRVLIEEGKVPFDLPGVDDDQVTPKTPLEQVKANRATKKLLKKYAKRAARHAAAALDATAEQFQGQLGEEAAARMKELAEKAAKARAAAQSIEDDEELEAIAEAAERARDAEEARQREAAHAASARETAAEL